MATKPKLNAHERARVKILQQASEATRIITAELAKLNTKLDEAAGRGDLGQMRRYEARLYAAVVNLRTV